MTSPGLHSPHGHSPSSVTLPASVSPSFNLCASSAWNTSFFTAPPPTALFPVHLPLIRISQEWHSWHLGWENSWLWRSCLSWTHCTMFSILPGLYPVDASSTLTLLLWQPKMPRDSSTCVLGAKLLHEHDCSKAVVFYFLFLQALCCCCCCCWYWFVDHTLNNATLNYSA